MWKENAGSSEFSIANTFADTAGQIDSFFTVLEPEEAFDILLRICKAADWNAWSAITLRDQMFSSTPNLVELAKQYSKNNSAAADEKSNKALSLSAEEFVRQYLISD